jgi:hypothetical protein
VSKRETTRAATAPTNGGADVVALDPRWDVAIELLVRGASQKLVAERVGVHRNTVRNWLGDPRFRVELARCADDHFAAAKVRRARVTERLVDRLDKVANDALDAASRDPTDPRAQRAAREWLRNYRELCRLEERIHGLAVQRP